MIRGQFSKNFLTCFFTQLGHFKWSEQFWVNVPWLQSLYSFIFAIIFYLALAVGGHSGAFILTGSRVFMLSSATSFLTDSSHCLSHPQADHFQKIAASIWIIKHTTQACYPSLIKNKKKTADEKFMRQEMLVSEMLAKSVLPLKNIRYFLSWEK